MGQSNYAPCPKCLKRLQAKLGRKKLRACELDSLQLFRNGAVCDACYREELGLPPKRVEFGIQSAMWELGL